MAKMEEQQSVHQKSRSVLSAPSCVLSRCGLGFAKFASQNKLEGTRKILKETRPPLSQFSFLPTEAFAYLNNVYKMVTLAMYINPLSDQHQFSPNNIEKKWLRELIK